MHLLHTVVLYIDSSAVWRLDHFHVSLLSTLLSLFSYLVFYLCYFKRRRSFWQNLLVGRKHVMKNYIIINGLFCQLVVLTLQCCCVPCASRQANQWLLTVTPHPVKKHSFVYLLLNLNSLRSNIKLLKSFTSIYLVHISLAEVMKFTDVRLKLWSSCWTLKKRECKEDSCVKAWYATLEDLGMSLQEIGARADERKCATQ